jgi:hypothetical protein
MRSIITSVLLGLGALGITAATPASSQASWLSEALHRRYDPDYYGAYYYAPAYPYDGPAYDYSYPAPYYDGYAAPYYAPYGAYYYGGPSYRYGRGDRHENHEWREHRGHESHRHHR